MGTAPLVTKAIQLTAALVKSVLKIVFSPIMKQA